MNDIKLEPCPYCGGEGAIKSKEIIRGVVTQWAVVCTQCGAASAITTDNTDNGRQMVVNSWNWESKRISAHKGR